MRYTLVLCAVTMPSFAQAQSGKGVEPWSGTAEQAALCREVRRHHHAGHVFCIVDQGSAEEAANGNDRGHESF